MERSISILERRVGSLTFKNPLLFGGGCCKTLADVSKACGTDAGGLEIGTITKLPRAGNPGPNNFHAVWVKGVLIYTLNSLGMPNPGKDYWTIHAKEAIRRAHDVGQKIGINIAGDTPKEIIEMVLWAMDMGFDWITINGGCPNKFGIDGKPLGTLTFDEGALEQLVDGLERNFSSGDGEVWRLRDRHPNLKICIEHASTIEAIEFVKADSSGNSFMTITPHHPTFTEHDFDHMGSDLKCKPIVQTPENQAAIDEFMVSGDERAGAGDDTAAHLKRMKDLEFDKAPNGCFYTSQGIAFYARRFIKAGAMDHRFENFMSRNAPRWWGLPEPSNDDTMTIIKSNADMPDPVPVPEDGDVVVPLGWKPQYEDQFHVGLAVQG